MPSNRGPQPSPDRSVTSGGLREGCWTRPATGETREERVSSAGREPRGQRPRRHTHRPPARSPARPPAPCGSERPRGLRALRAAGTQERSPCRRSSASSRPAWPGRASHPQAPQEEQDASSQESTANGSDRSIAFRQTAASQGGREGGGAARVKGRAATSPGEELGKVRPGQGFQSAPGTPDFRLGRGDWARFLAGEGSA